MDEVRCVIGPTVIYIHPHADVRSRSVYPTRMHCVYTYAYRNHTHHIRHRHIHAHTEIIHITYVHITYVTDIYIRIQKSYTSHTSQTYLPPATVETSEVCAESLRTAQLPKSAMYASPAGVSVMLRGKERPALAAAPSLLGGIVKR